MTAPAEGNRRSRRVRILALALGSWLTGLCWLYGETPVWEEKHRLIEPNLIGLEHLRAIKWACWSERLDDNAVEDIFWNNGARLFGV